tara:strand:+ start:840 stop:1937 length:1098 start_codon:yes stop_codon:yes gene_type:complete
MAPIKGTQSRTGGKLIRGGRSTDVTSDIDGTATEISGRREDNLTTLLTVSGGTKIESGNDRYHVFTTPGTFTTGSQLTAEVLVVASGGSGAGAAYGGGGGAGGVLHAPSTSLEKGRYTVTVGGQGYDGGWYSPGGDGDDSSFAGVTAKGGGAGTGYLNGPAVRRGPTAGTITVNGRAGGSSGGSGVQYPGSPSPDPVLPQPAPSDYTAYGNVGGNGGGGPSHGFAAGGGGGAGGTGYAAESTTAGGGDGGAGRAFPGFPGPVIAPAIPAPVRPGWTPVVGPTGIFAGGGGGGNYYTESPQTGSSGGSGGGGAGAPGAPPTGANAAGDAIRFTGSGGGGGNYPNPSLVSHGGKGGDGIVIVKYSVA